MNQKQDVKSVRKDMLYHMMGVLVKIQKKKIIALGMEVQLVKFVILALQRINPTISIIFQKI